MLAILFLFIGIIDTLAAGEFALFMWKLNKVLNWPFKKFDQELSGLPIVFVDSIHIEQVLINLIRNSVEAMLQVDAKPRVITIRTQLNENGIPLIEIADTGPGIDKNTLSQIFEPFVTTKGTKGMGMGC